METPGKIVQFPASMRQVKEALKEIAKGTRPDTSLDDIDQAIESEWKMLELLGQAKRGVRLHTCSVCGKAEPWGPTWSWYGSLMDCDNGDVVKYCGPDCFNKRKAKHKP